MTVSSKAGPLLLVQSIVPQDATGKVTIARDPTLALQQNILAALQKPELLLGAQEEFVLTGWYYREVE